VAGAAVFLLMVLAVVVAWPASQPTVGTTEPSVSVAPPAPTDVLPADVHFTITNALGPFEIADTADVYSYGKRVGTLQINSSSPTAELPVTGPPGLIDYQLQITIALTNEYGGGTVTLNGSGSITAYEGARYSIQITENPSGELVATLQAEESGI
jgi:hypothetical protein